ncbi:hypothetical protein [Hydrogenophaga laconesensis]|uniref:Lipoprotein n=1 Tax=Hydrogenophaga laconesensis TaxID=1805971 RepID=A0ABU1VHW9_9BURK|nr:hypothetical protein [Hydrogenophaga laconesensis]MDR7097082.1 hypothetical protein [Hydrogenophaga laconesensis]
MNTLLSSRMVLGVAVAMTSVVLLAGCDRRATDVPPPTTNEMERDRTSPSPMPGTPATPGMPPVSDPAAPAAPAAPGTPAPGGTTP